MRTARFWTGVVMLTVPAMAILLAIPARRSAPSGPVDGTVALHGRPLTGGMIFFTPEGPRGGEGMSARIDRDGHFECDPGWRRDRAAWLRYRVDILPDAPGVAPHPRRDGAGDGDETGGATDREPVGAGARGPIRRVVPVSWQAQRRPAIGRDIGVGRRRSGDSYTVPRGVRLGPEPAHLDIDLED